MFCFACADTGRGRRCFPIHCRPGMRPRRRSAVRNMAPAESTEAGVSGAPAAGRRERGAPPPPVGQPDPRPNTHQPHLRAPLRTPAHDAGSRKLEVGSALSRRATRLLARSFSSREKGLARVAEPMAFPAPGFKRARALRTSAGIVHGSDPGLLREAAVSGRHPGRRDGPAAASAGRRGQR